MSTFDYEIKTIMLANGRPSFAMVFADPANHNLTYFMSSDAGFLTVESDRVVEVRKVLDGEVAEVSGSGNITSWVITKSLTTIRNLFEDIAEEESWADQDPPVIVSTSLFETLVRARNDAYWAFRAEKDREN